MNTDSMHIDKKSKLDEISQKRLALEAQLEALKKEEEDATNEIRTQEREEKWKVAKPGFVTDVKNTFTQTKEFFASKIQSYQERGEEFDDLAVGFLELQLSHLESLVTTNIKTAKRKHNLKSFSHELLTVNGVDVTRSLPKKAGLEESSSDDVKGTIVEQEIVLEEKIGLPRGPFIGMVRHILLNHKLSTQADVDKLFALQKESKLTNTKGRGISNPKSIYAAKHIYESMQTVTLITDPIDLELVKAKHTVTQEDLFGSFFSFCLKEGIIDETQNIILQREGYISPKGIELFFNVTKIPLPSKGLKEVDTSALENAFKERKIGDEDTLDNAGISPEDLEKTLILGAGKFDMSDGFDFYFERGSATQMFTKLTEWFKEDIKHVARLAKFTGVEKYDDEFMENLRQTRNEIDKLVITKELYELCEKTKPFFIQLKKFIHFYCEQTYTMPDAAIDLYTKDIPVIDFINDDAIRNFLKLVLPQIGYNLKSYHVYAHIVGFTNKVKDKQGINDLFNVTGTFEECLDSVKSKKIENNKKSKKVTRKIDNNSELMTERDSTKIEKYFTQQCKVGDIQDKYFFFRNNDYENISASDYIEWDQLIAATNDILVGLKNLNIISSNNKHNLLTKHLDQYKKGDKHNNTISGMAKRRKQINFARELRKIVTD